MNSKVGGKGLGYTSFHSAILARGTRSLQDQYPLWLALWGQVSKLTTLVKNFLPDLTILAFPKAKIGFRFAPKSQAKQFACSIKNTSF